MKSSSERLYPGDIVEVKAPDEILQSLDIDGTLGNLPFMPEMVEFCGKRFRVSRRALKTCIYGPVIGMWLFWRIRKMILGQYARGTQKTTPVESLNLQPGESVEVRSIGDIRDSLNDKACNRGLQFFSHMRLLCGSRSRVRSRLDKLIVDGSGEMRQISNTVYLEGSMCGCEFSLGGCPRNEFAYWREIWLRR